eukprot:234737-Pleurochrysis_carterae.AAC.2
MPRRRGMLSDACPAWDEHPPARHAKRRPRLSRSAQEAASRNYQKLHIVSIPFARGLVLLERRSSFEAAFVAGLKRRNTNRLGSRVLLHTSPFTLWWNRSFVAAAFAWMQPIRRMSP